MSKGTTCRDCARKIAWGQTNDNGVPLEEAGRLKRCWDCAKKRRDARKPK